MQKLLQAGALALALTGFAFGGTVAPAEAATMHYGAPGAGVTVHVGPRWHPRHHIARHRVKVCTVKVHWHNHHKVRVRTCRIEWRPLRGRYM
jgi:hypothetical protein